MNSFSGCIIKNITVDSANPYFKIKDGMLYDITGTLMYLSPSVEDESGGLVVTIPGYSGMIPDNAYAGNTTISKIIIEEGINYIGDYAFAGMTNLKEIVIPNSVGWMGEYVLDNSSVKKITIGSGLNSYAPCAMQTVLQLESITVDPNNQWYQSMGGIMYKKTVNGELEPIFNPLKNSNITVEIPSNLSATLPRHFVTNEIIYRFGGPKTQNFTMTGSSPYYIVENGVLYANSNDKREIFYTFLKIQGRVML